MRQISDIQRPLERAELRALVERIVAQPELWQGLVRRDTGERHFAELASDANVGVWVISWAEGNDTGFHDHDTSCGAVAVVEGKIIEERLVLGGPPRRIEHSAGEVFDFAATHVHRMLQEPGAHSVSIHAYSPPLNRMGAYVFESDGTLNRRSISYVEELRPMDAAA